MDPAKLQAVYQRLDMLDDRLSHRVRPRQPVNMGRLTPQLMEERLRDLSEFSIELKDIVRDLLRSIAPTR